MGRVRHLPDSCLQTSLEQKESSQNMKYKELSANTVAFISYRHTADDAILPRVHIHLLCSDRETSVIAEISQVFVCLCVLSSRDLVTFLVFSLSFHLLSSLYFIFLLGSFCSSDVYRHVRQVSHSSHFLNIFYHFTFPGFPFILIFVVIKIFFS